MPLNNNKTIVELLNDVYDIDTNAIRVNLSGETSGGGGDLYWVSGSTGTNSLTTKANLNNGGDATGIYSIATGYNTTANSHYSIANGYNTLASGDYSTANGRNTISSGNYSTASGYYTTASGDYSTASGYHSIASNYGSTASGYYSTASGNYSFAGGSRTIASGNRSFNFSDAIATDLGVTCDTAAILGGYGNNIINNGLGSFIAAGYKNLIKNQYSFATGKNNTTNGVYSFIAGNNNEISDANYNSAVFGSNNISNGSDTFVTGKYNTTSGYYTTASGYHTTASGYYSTASGYYSIASGITTFNYSYYTAGNTTSGATGDYSAILGGQNNHITSTAYNSAILGGTGNTINHKQSVILGGYDIITTADNTVYVDNLNIETANSSTTYQSKSLGQDSNNNIIDINGKFNNRTITVITSDYTLNVETDNLLAVNTTSGDITITIPDSSTITDTDIIRYFRIYKHSNDNNLVIINLSGETYPLGYDTIILKYPEEFIDIGGNSTIGWNKISSQKIGLLAHRTSNWSASNFTTEAAIPFEHLDISDNSKIFEWTGSTPTRITSYIKTRINISYSVDFNSTGGGAWSSIVRLRKNGTDIIGFSELKTGNSGNEDQSVTFSNGMVEMDSGDYLELMVYSSNFSGDIDNALITIDSLI